MPRQRLTPIEPERPIVGDWVPTEEESVIIAAKVAESERLDSECEASAEAAAAWMDSKIAWAENLLGYQKPERPNDEAMAALTSWF